MSEPMGEGKPMDPQTLEEWKDYAEWVEKAHALLVAENAALKEALAVLTVTIMAGEPGDAEDFREEFGPDGMQDLLKRTAHLKKNFRVEKYIHAALTK